METEILSKVTMLSDKLQHIKFNSQAAIDFAASISTDDLAASKLKLSHYEWQFEDLLKIVIYFNAMNFCFWAEREQPKWSVVIDGKCLDGSTALFRIIEENAKRQQDFLNPEVIADLTLQEFKDIFAGTVEIPLVVERYQNLVNVGKVLVEEFDSSVVNIIAQGNFDAMQLLEIIESKFTAFEDTQEYLGQQLPFLKRAQLEVKMIDDQLKRFGKEGLRNMNKLTAFADYKIPQLLRHIGILEYDSHLAKLVDTQTLIEKDAPEEVEMRIATIFAVELVYKELSKRYPSISSCDVDTLLWLNSQKNNVGIMPYHRTYTAAY